MRVSIMPIIQINFYFQHVRSNDYYTVRAAGVAKRPLQRTSAIGEKPGKEECGINREVNKS